MRKILFLAVVVACELMGSDAGSAGGAQGFDFATYVQDHRERVNPYEAARFIAHRVTASHLQAIFQNKILVSATLYCIKEKELLFRSSQPCGPIPAESFFALSANGCIEFREAASLVEELPLRIAVGDERYSVVCCAPVADVLLYWLGLKNVLSQEWVCRLLLGEVPVQGPLEADVGEGASAGALRRSGVCPTCDFWKALNAQLASTYAARHEADKREYDVVCGQLVAALASARKMFEPVRAAVECRLNMARDEVALLRAHVLAEMPRLNTAAVREVEAQVKEIADMACSELESAREEAFVTKTCAQETIAAMQLEFDPEIAKAAAEDIIKRAEEKGVRIRQEAVERARAEAEKERCSLLSQAKKDAEVIMEGAANYLSYAEAEAAAAKAAAETIIANAERRAQEVSEEIIKEAELRAQEIYRQQRGAGGDAAAQEPAAAGQVCGGRGDRGGRGRGRGDRGGRGGASARK